MNEEIEELSDSIKQLSSDVSNIENSERNSAKNLKSAAGEISHKLNETVGHVYEYPTMHYFGNPSELNQ